MPVPAPSHLSARRHAPAGPSRRALALPAVLLVAAAAAGACTLVPPPDGGGSTTTTAGTPTTTASGPTTTAPASGCPTALFPDLSGAAGAGAGYAKPSVQVSCSATELLVTSNGMPSYTFTPKTPNPLGTQSWSWHVPLHPTLAATNTSIVNRLGTLGFTVTGLPIYGPTEGPVPSTEAYGDPVYNGILDTCKGHTGPNKEYHNHALLDSSSCGFGVSPVLGYALDGFPIYGPRGCLDAACTQVVTFTSGYELTGNPKTYSWKAYTYVAKSDPTVLDACNGRTLPDGTYAYVATSTFPYTFGCFRGTPTSQTGAAAAAMPAMS